MIKEILSDYICTILALTISLAARRPHILVSGNAMINSYQMRNDVINSY
jgi:hypothetical protein